MRRAWRIYRSFLRSSVVQMLQFKADFIAKVMSIVSWLVFVAFAVSVTYNNTTSIAGWERGPAFVLAGTAFLISAFNYMLCPALLELPEQFRRGSLDFVLTKPVDSQFWVSFRRFSLSDLGTCLGSAAMVAYGVATSAHRPTPAEWGSYVVCAVSGAAVLYSLRLALMTVGVWFTRVDNLWVLEESAMQMARNPIEIYSRPVRAFLTYGVPLALFSTVPARQVTGAAQPLDLPLCTVWAVIAVMLSRRFWQFAMRSYSSASS